MSRSLFRFTAFSAVFAATVSAVFAAPFTSGNLVISRVGDQSGLSTLPSALYIDEYTTAGTPVGNTIALPTTASGLNKSIVTAATSTSAAFLTRSVNGEYLTIGGTADLPVGTTTTGGVFSSSAYPNRVIAFIDWAGNTDTTTTFVAGGSNPRSSVSTNGVDLWVASDTGAGTTGGLRYFTKGQTTPGTLLNSTTTNTRNVNIFNGQLYLSTDTGATNNGVNSVGTGLPTTATTLTFLPNTNTDSEYDFFFANPTTLYVADDSSIVNDRGISKWTFNGATWVKQWNVATDDARGVRSLTGAVDGSGNVTLYAISTEVLSTSGTAVTVTTPNRLVSMIDTGGPPQLSLTNLATAPANTIWRGVDFAPIPEPSAIVIGVALSGVGIWLRRRK
jgi:hypothetical protein